MDFYFQSDLREKKKASVAFSAEKCYHRSVFSKQVLRYEDTKRIKARDLKRSAIKAALPDNNQH